MVQISLLIDIVSVVYFSYTMNDGFIVTQI